MTTSSVQGQSLPATITFQDLITIDGEQRMPDIRIAEALGFERPRKIREIIERHRVALERFGSIAPYRGAKSTSDPIGRGRRPEGYALNRKQALYICTKSETANATEVTIQMVEVFDAVTGAWCRTRRPQARPRDALAEAQDIFRFVFGRSGGAS